MSNRIDADRQAELEPKRVATAKQAIQALGFDITHETDREIWFYYKHSLIKFFPYSGWATGKTIQDGRGLQNLLNQISTIQPK